MAENSVSHATTPPEASSPLLVALFGLTFVTGVIDAVSFLALGHVFTANMTGNVVLLGFALGGTADLSVGRSLAALCAFAIGSVVGGRLTNERQRTPARLLLIAMHAEVLFLCLAAAAAPIAGGDTSFARLSPVIVLTAVAMGLRNAVVRRGVRSLLESHEGWEVCGEATTGRDAVAQTRDGQRGTGRHDTAATARNVGPARRRGARGRWTGLVPLSQRTVDETRGRCTGAAARSRTLV